jgi:CBS domain-containing protein
MISIFEKLLRFFRRKKLKPEKIKKKKVKIYRKVYRKRKKILVSQLMTPNVICVDKNSTLDQVVDLFISKNISGAPVIKKGKLLGEISKTDILKLVNVKSLEEIDEEKMRKLEKMKVSEIMKKPICIRENATIEQVKEKMRKYGIHRLLVLDKKKKLVGIITATDLARGVSKEKISKTISTTIDKMLEIVERKGAIDIKSLSKILEVSPEVIEEWAKILEENGLIKLEYPALGKPILRWTKTKII